MSGLCSTLSSSNMNIPAQSVSSHHHTHLKIMHTCTQYHWGINFLALKKNAIISYTYHFLYLSLSFPILIISYTYPYHFLYLSLPILIPIISYTYHFLYLSLSFPILIIAYTYT